MYTHTHAHTHTYPRTRAYVHTHTHTLHTHTHTHRIMILHLKRYGYNYQLSENSKRVDNNIRILRYINVGKLRAQNTTITVSAFGVDIDSTNVEVEDATLYRQ